MKVAKTIPAVRALIHKARAAGKSIGFVPTMGALHAGHISLIEAAKKKCDYVVVSIFVNPTQFGPKEDFKRYPRPIGEDLRVCRKTGADLVFIPTVKQMYPFENLTWVNVEKIGEPLCGRFRPGHFRGVATVCTKLFNIITPDIAFFGQKDIQQTVIVKRMVSDFNMPLKIAVCPTVRHPDGLALSSRNLYLSAKQRRQAVFVFKSLKKAKEMANSGIKDTQTIISQMQKMLKRIPSVKIEYISFVQAETLEEVKIIKGNTIAAVAVKLGRIRLIDNIVLKIKSR